MEISKNFKFLIYASFFLLIGIASSIFFLLKETDSQFASCTKNLVAGGKSTIGGEFSLINKDSKNLTSKEVITIPSLIYFGYSYCPDVCPFDLQRNATAVDILSSKNISVTPIFITIDPKRDTPERVGDFASFLHPKMVGLTGSKSQINNAMKQFKVYGKKASSSQEGDMDYLMDHSAFTYFVHPDLGFLEYFNRETSSEEVAQTIACFLEKI